MNQTDQAKYDFGMKVIALGRYLAIALMALLWLEHPRNDYDGD